MKQYKPQVPFRTPYKILSSTLKKVNGVNKVNYNELPDIYYCSAKAFVGVNKNINDISAEEDVLTVEGWYTPLLKKNDRIKLLDDNSIWEVYITPENINRQGQYMKFKVVSING